MNALPRPRLGIGQVRHTRLRPVRHAFHYPTWFVLLPMRSLRAQPCPELSRNRRAMVSFHDRDHGEGGDDALAWIEGLLASEGVTDADGEIWLHTYPRVLGYVFKPVSFWYCHRTDGSLTAVVVEVNNTFGERHCYLLAGPELAFGRELAACKVFHVSPFCEVTGAYRFRFMRTDLGADAPTQGRTVARVEHFDEHGTVLQTSVSGDLAPLSRERMRHALLSMPLMTLALVARIHWQALRLWLARVPFVRKPTAPTRFVTR